MSYSFVAITDDYISYLRKTEPHVMSNKQDERTYHRKYIGIIEKLNGFSSWKSYAPSTNEQS
ncbi:MAG: type III toxin-antitoxin system ToxN/AbiQ family toxin [Treponema sp.]|nr:type III toxin-antitoxin system ToxN/AbiQ family toxin [Treponema sp.]